MKISARPSFTAALSTATDGSSNSSQSSQTLVSRTSFRQASREQHELGSSALLHEHDRVLAEQAAERFGVLAVDAHHQAARLAPAAVRLAPLARAPWIARGRDELVEHRERGRVLRGGFLLAARIGGGHKCSGRRMFALKKSVESRAGLADLQHQLGLGEYDIVGALVRGHQFPGNHGYTGVVIPSNRALSCSARYS